jgi:hypothetical protein
MVFDWRFERIVIPGNTSSQGKYVDPPTSVSASAGNAQATVSFSLPAYDGKGVATYLATSSPGGITGSGSSSPITVTGLSNGTAYTFTVSTISGYGVSATSSASNSVTPVAPPYFPPFFPPDFTTTTTAPPDPCAGVSCAGSPPGGSWTPVGNYQACIQSICGPFIGNWTSYVIYGSNGTTVCCSFGLFNSCDYGSGAVCPT